MKIVLQRVKKASVKVNNEITGEINKGILVFFATKNEDMESQIPWLVKKIVDLRIFSDENGKMNLSVKDVEGEILIVSQFTLYGNCLSGRRPSFTDAMQPQKANVFYEKFISAMKEEVKNVQTGIFGADMEVSLVNDGPATFIIEAKKD